MVTPTNIIYFNNDNNDKGAAPTAGLEFIFTHLV